MKIDLIRFESDVVKKGAEACLPSNLTDEWLYQLLMAYESVYAGIEGVTLSAHLRAIMEVMFYKLQTNKLTLEDSELKRLLDDYRFELTIEELSRKSDIEANRADLSSIFTNRQVQFKRKLID